MIAIGAMGSRDARAQDRAVCLASYDAGQALRDDRKLVEARAQLTVCASNACPAVLRRDCLEWLHAIDAILPTIVLRAVDAQGRDETRVEVDLEGTLLVRSLDGKAVRINPGPHALRFRAASLAPVEVSVVIAEGEMNRVVSVNLPAPAAHAPSDGSPVPSTTAARGMPGWLPWALGGIGFAALGGATYFYAKGIHDGDALRDRCGTPPTCPRNEVDAANTKLLIGDVFAGVGLVAIGVGVFFLVSGASSSRVSATSDRISLTF
jgi:hypothetical protein